MQRELVKILRIYIILRLVQKIGNETLKFPYIVHALFFDSRFAWKILLYGKLCTRKKIRYEKEITISRENSKQ